MSSARYQPKQRLLETDWARYSEEVLPDYFVENEDVEKHVRRYAKGEIDKLNHLSDLLEETRGRAQDIIVEMALAASHNNGNFNVRTVRKAVYRCHIRLTEAREVIKRLEGQVYSTLTYVAQMRHDLCAMRGHPNIVRNDGPSQWWLYGCRDCGDMTYKEGGFSTESPNFTALPLGANVDD